MVSLPHVSLILWFCSVVPLSSVSIHSMDLSYCFSIILWLYSYIAQRLYDSIFLCFHNYMVLSSYFPITLIVVLFYSSITIRFHGTMISIVYASVVL